MRTGVEVWLIAMLMPKIEEFEESSDPSSERETALVCENAGGGVGGQAVMYEPVW
jgi:hypothetical protein